jgi:multidrug efflux pump subunit AcrA (membrane-fusion protein)
MNKLPVLLVGLVLLAGCAKKEESSVPEISDDPVLVKVGVESLSEAVAGQGIAEGDCGLKVALASGDASKVHRGQQAEVWSEPGHSVSARVTRILPDASQETGQAVAWLEASRPCALRAGSAVSVSISAISMQALTVPEKSLLVLEGKQVVVRQETDEKGKPAFKPVEVTTGRVSQGRVEVLSGLKAGDEIVQSGGIGYLYPDFKSAAGD